MPRGTRAIHGAEVTGDHHAHGGAHGTFVQVVEPWLAITCWCERHVVQVEQAIFRELGVTYSCGADDCHGPDGDRTETPTFLTERDVYLSMGIARRNHDGEAVDFAAVHVPPIGKRRPKPKPTRPVRKGYVQRFVEPRRAGYEDRTPREQVALRRDRVEQMYGRGMTIIDIAAVLDVPFHTARNDVAWLRRHGRVS